MPNKQQNPGGINVAGSAALLAAGIGIVLVPLCIAFNIWTATTGWDFLRFLLALTLIAYLPGWLLLDSAGLRPHGLDEVLLSLIVGAMACSLAYWICAWSGLGRVWLVWPVVACAFAIRRRSRADMIPVGGRLIHLGLAAIFLLVAAPFAIAPTHYRNLVALPGGGMSIYPIPDVVMHVSIANELGHSMPPQVPFLPGAALNYHLGPDLLVHIFSDAGWISTIDLTVRFMPTLYMAMAVAAVFCFARIWLRSERAALLTTLLVIFGEDFSFVPGLLTGSEYIWAAQFFRVPTIYSLYSLNPMLPGLAMLFSIFLCLLRFDRGEGRAWAVLATLLLVGLMEVKVFAAAQVVGSLAATAFFYAWTRRDFGLLRVLLLTLLLAIPAAWGTLGDGSAQFAIRMESGGYVSHALSRTGLAETALGQQAMAFASEPSLTFGAVVFLLLALPGYLLGSFGARCLGLLVSSRRFRISRSDSRDRLRLLLVAFVLAGPVVTLLWTLKPAGYDVEGLYDNAVWFYVQSKFVAWIFAAEVLVVFLRKRQRIGRILGVTLVLCLSLPSTLQYFDFLWTESKQGRILELSPEYVEALRHLDDTAAAGEVVFVPKQIAAAVVVLTDCRAPVLSVYPQSFISQEEFQERVRDVDLFWQEWARGKVRRDVLGRWRATYVVSPRTNLHPTLTPIFMNEYFMIYNFPIDPLLPNPSS